MHKKNNKNYSKNPQKAGAREKIQTHMMNSSTKREAVKVVLIDTQYVETDPMSFKSVVQKLTGKDSCVSWIKESSSGSATAINSEKTTRDNKLGDAYGYNIQRGSANGSVSMLSKGMSFKDLDRLFLEFPAEEFPLLYRIDL